MSYLTLGEEADAPARAVWEGFEPLFLERILSRLDHEAREWTKCGHVDPRNPRLLTWLAKDVAWVFFRVLQGTSAEHQELRQRLREALVVPVDYDAIAPRIRELAKAVRRREVYNVVRRAAALLEELGEADPAALLAEYALQHEPVDDGAAFSRVRRRSRAEGAAR